MITEADITKLKKIFATKSDLKDALKDYATKSDLKDALKDYATKSDLKDALKDYSTKSDLKEAVADLRAEIGEVRDTVETTAAAVARIENAIDGLAGVIQDQRTENGAGAVHLARHDRQIGALALATGVTLPD